jgi:hypothetical protein
VSGKQSLVAQSASQIAGTRSRSLRVAKTSESILSVLQANGEQADIDLPSAEIQSSVQH